MDAVPIYDANPSKSSSPGPTGHFPQNFGMLHRGLLPIIVCSNDDPGVTLTYFTARFNLVLVISSPEPKAHR